MEHVYSLLITMETPLQRVKECCYNEKATTLKEYLSLNLYGGGRRAMVSLLTHAMTNWWQFDD